jgi:hypothetical protein
MWRNVVICYYRVPETVCHRFLFVGAGYSAQCAGSAEETALCKSTELKVLYVIHDSQLFEVITADRRYVPVCTELRIQSYVSVGETVPSICFRSCWVNVEVESNNGNES